MPKSRLAKEQIIGILKEADVSSEVRTLCRRHGVKETHVFYWWRKKYGGLEVSVAR